MTTAIREVAAKMLGTLISTAEHVAPLLAAADYDDPECQGHNNIVPAMVFLLNLPDGAEDWDIGAQVFLRDYAGEEDANQAWNEVWAVVSIAKPDVVVMACEVIKLSDQFRALEEAGIEVDPGEDPGLVKALEVCAAHHKGGTDFDVAAAISRYHIQDDGSVAFEEPEVWDKLPTQMLPALQAMAAQVFAPKEATTLSSMAGVLRTLGHIVIVHEHGEEEL